MCVALNTSWWNRNIWCPVVSWAMAHSACLGIFSFRWPVSSKLGREEFLKCTFNEEICLLKSLQYSKFDLLYYNTLMLVFFKYCLLLFILVFFHFKIRKHFLKNKSKPTYSPLNCIFLPVCNIIKNEQIYYFSICLAIL